MSEARVDEDLLATLRAVTATLTSHALADPSLLQGETAAVRLERIGLLEDLRSVVAAVQVSEVAAFSAECRAAIELDIATVERPGIGRRRRREQSHRRMIAQVQQARRISSYQALRFVAFAEQARTDLPETCGLLATGRLSERRAVSVFTAVDSLAPEQRRAVDAELAPELPSWGDRRVDQKARAAVYRIDPAGAVKRNAYAVSQRRVSVRPAPECMAWVTALTTMPVAVAMRAQLLRDAKAATAAGDARTQGQLMADTIAARVLNSAASAAPAGAEFTGPVAIQLVMSDRTLLGGDEPARFPDGTPYPAPLARALAFGNYTSDSAAARSIRRLFTDPAGRLITAETNSRNFTRAQREFIQTRNELCTTPWCDAPIVDIDHDNPHVRGGPTSCDNARGKCRWCNVTKGDQAPEPEPRDDPEPARAGPPRSLLERRTRRRLDLRIRRATRRATLFVELSSHAARC